MDATPSNEDGAVADGNMKESPAFHVQESAKEKKAGVIVNFPNKGLLYKVVKYSRKENVETPRRLAKTRGTLFNCPLCVFVVETKLSVRDNQP